MVFERTEGAVSNGQAVEAAEIVERILATLPPATPRDVGVARRLEGAVIALRLLSGRVRRARRGQ
jgi:hypothetical protein